MLAIRLQRTGRHGHAQFRLIVQDSRFSPKSGRVVAFLGSYDPHTKEAKIDTEKAASYLANGAQPSDRAARLLQKEGVKLPDWVKLAEPKKRDIRHPEKLRRNRPEEEKPAEPAKEESPPEEAEPAEQAPEQTEAPEESGEETSEQPSEEAAPEEAKEEAPEEPAAESEPQDGQSS
jgi:small subunit ribosomal protein S16